MSRDWKQVFSSWAAGPGETEERKISNTLTQIRAAIHNDLILKTKDITVYVQGSYKNNVNVRVDSDIDVGVLCKELMDVEFLDDDLSKKVNSKISETTYTYNKFREDLYFALKNHFGEKSVNSGNKSFDINESSTRVDADVVAVIEHRRYDSETSYIEGVCLYPKNGTPSKVINWPDQHYTNGVNKNNNSGRRYKRIVRILKKLRNEMLKNGYNYLENVSGFLIECLVWNTPNHILTDGDYYDAVRETLIFLFDELDKKDNYKEWGEVSELKYLFRTTQSWKKIDARRFIINAWNYVGF